MIVVRCSMSKRSQIFLSGVTWLLNAKDASCAVKTQIKQIQSSLYPEHRQFACDPFGIVQVHYTTFVPEAQKVLGVKVVLFFQFDPSKPDFQKSRPF